MTDLMQKDLAALLRLLEFAQGEANSLGLKEPAYLIELAARLCRGGSENPEAVPASDGAAGKPQH